MEERMTAAARYKKLRVRREHFLDRAQAAASLTIPSLMPPEGHTSSSRLPEPYQGLGARAVVNLASRLMVAMYPPGMSSFRLTVPPEALIEAGTLEADEGTEKGLALVERVINAEIERRQWRQPTFLGLQYLIVAGNVLEQMLDDNTIRVFRLDQYCVVRDSRGRLREIVIEEKYAPESLPEEARAVLDADDAAAEKINLYTWAKYDAEADEWKIHQEVSGQIIPGSDGEYETNPFNAIRWTAVVGEDYGRGKVDEHIGDFRALDGLSKAILDGSALASLNIKMIRPNAAGGHNLRRRLAKAQNGDWVVGNPEDVGMLQFENIPGMQFTAAELEGKKQEIASAFLLTSSVQRDAERVTAYEVRKMAEELEGVLGGVYSMLSSDLQLHRLERLMIQMQDADQLPEMPEGMVEPTILTGVEALGREQDVQRVSTALQFLAGLPPEIIQDYVKWSPLLGKAFNGLQLPDAVRTDQEAQQVRQQREAAGAQTAAATEGARAMAKRAGEGA